MTPEGQIALYAYFTALPDAVDDVARMITALAAEVRHREGNLAFEVHREKSNPRRFFVYEVYESQHSFDHHLSTPANERFNEEIVHLIEEPETQLEWLSPRSV